MSMSGAAANLAAQNADAASREEQALAARFLDAMHSRVNSDPHLVWRGRTLTTDCLVQIGTTAFLLRIESGRVRECLTEFPLLCSWTFAIRGTARAWTSLWQEPPPPGWHDLFALSKRDEMSLEGNLHPFMAHLQYLKDVLALPRQAAA